jgi:DNA-binding CsgD family transcriptional regulator
MMSLGRTVEDIGHALATFDVEGKGGISDLMPRIRELFATEIACVYSVAGGDSGWELSRYHANGFPASFQRRFGEFLASAPRRFGVYDPGCPEPMQRNRVIESTRLAARSGQQLALRRVFEPAGLGDHGHLRVLLCEGPSLLGWFGMLSRDPFTARQRTALRALARPMHKRLLTERRLERGQLASAAMDALLDAVAVPAFIIDDRATIRELNTAARSVLDSRGHEIRAALADALAHRPTTPHIELTRLHERGIATYWLALVEVDRAVACVAAATRRFGLTAREAEVLLWVARGASNQRIAIELACSERNVEAHLARIFGKTDVPSRTALVARVLTQL